MKKSIFALVVLTLCSQVMGSGIVQVQGSHINPLCTITAASFVGPLTGAVTGGVTGTVTGHSTLDLPLTGGTLTGALTVQAAASAVTISTSATSSISMCIIGGVTALPTSVYNSGCFAKLQSDGKVYISTMSPVTAAGDWKALW